jgi:hypothetical protein
MKRKKKNEINFKKCNKEKEKKTKKLVFFIIYI